MLLRNFITQLRKKLLRLNSCIEFSANNVFEKFICSDNFHFIAQGYSHLSSPSALEKLNFQFESTKSSNSDSISHTCGTSRWLRRMEEKRRGFSSSNNNLSSAEHFIAIYTAYACNNFVTLLVYFAIWGNIQIFQYGRKRMFIFLLNKLLHFSNLYDFIRQVYR